MRQDRDRLADILDIGMRNVLIHGYFDIDWERVWLAASRDIPSLKDSIKKILEAEGG